VRSSTKKLNNIAYCGYAIGRAVEKRQRWLQEARNVKYLKQPGWATDLPAAVRYAREANREVIEQLRLLRQDDAIVNPQ
jgi:hypothetical protein